MHAIKVECIRTVAPWSCGSLDPVGLDLFLQSYLVEAVIWQLEPNLRVSIVALNLIAIKLLC